MKMTTGRQLKLVISISAILFCVYIVIFGEQVVDEVKKDIQQYQEQNKIKSLLDNRSIRVYNLEHFLDMSEGLGKISNKLVGDNFDVDKLKELDNDTKTSILYISQDDTRWWFVVDALFILADGKADTLIDPQEFDEFAEFMSLNDEHKDDIVKLFDKIDFDDSGYIDNEELHNYMTSFQRILNNNLVNTNSTKSTKKRILKKKDANKNGQFLLDLIETGLQLAGDQDEYAREVQQSKSLDFYSNKIHWDAISGLCFSILDKNQNGFITNLELDDFSRQFKLDAHDLEWLLEEAKMMDQEVMRGQFNVDKFEFTSMSDRIYQIYVKYNGRMDQIEN